MKNHVWRPLFAVIGLVAVIFAARFFIVPKDFGVGERGYMYGWHRKGDEDVWKAFRVKYRFDDSFCRDCHGDKYESIMQSPHSIIFCENCHGPALDHPSDPQKLKIEKRREQCLRCHYPLPYPTSGRSNIRGIDPEKHNPGMECSHCHNPHRPGLEGLK